MPPGQPSPASLPEQKPEAAATPAPPAGKLMRSERLEMNFGLEAWPAWAPPPKAPTVLPPQQSQQEGATQQQQMENPGPENPDKNSGATPLQNAGPENPDKNSGATPLQNPRPENPDKNSTATPLQNPGAENPDKNSEATPLQNPGAENPDKNSRATPLQNPGGVQPGSALPTDHPVTGKGAVYTALASGIISDIVYNRASSFELKDQVLSIKDGESEEDMIYRVAHLLYVRMNRSLKSTSTANSCPGFKAQRIPTLGTYTEYAFPTLCFKAPASRIY